MTYSPARIKEVLANLSETALSFGRLTINNSLNQDEASNAAVQRRAEMLINGSVADCASAATACSVRRYCIVQHLLVLVLGNLVGVGLGAGVPCDTIHNSTIRPSR